MRERGNCRWRAVSLPLGASQSGGASTQGKGIIMDEFDGECLDGPEGCRGEVVEHAAISGSGLYYPRCDQHYEAYVTRLQPRMDEINARYPERAPADFDPAFCGESWDEDGW